MWLIKQLSTGLYLADSGQWVEDVKEAKRYPSEYCTQPIVWRYSERGIACMPVMYDIDNAVRG